MSEPTEARVREIIINELGVEGEKVTDEASFVEDLGADSLENIPEVKAGIHHAAVGEERLG